VGGTFSPYTTRLLPSTGLRVRSVIAAQRGSKGELDLGPLLQKRLTVTGSTLRPRTVEQKGAIARALEVEVWPLVEAGRVRPVIHATVPLAQAALAHHMLETGAHIGKVVLVV